MSEKLIPCPICGSENTVRLPYNDHADIERCKNCNLTIIVPFGYTMWNTRPIEDALNARIIEVTHLYLQTKDAFNLVTEVLLKQDARIAKLEEKLAELVEVGNKMRDLIEQDYDGYLDETIEWRGVAEEADDVLHEREE